MDHPEQLPPSLADDSVRYATRRPWVWIRRRGPEDVYGKGWLAFLAFVCLCAGIYAIGAQATALGAFLTGFTYCALASTYAQLPRVGRSQYRRGYWNARYTFWASMNEAVERGMSPAEWLAAEQERDMAMMLVESGRKP